MLGRFTIAASPHLPAVRPLSFTTLSDEQFERARRLALTLTGIGITDRHRELLARRCLRLGISDTASLDAVLRSAERGDAPAVRELVSLLTTKFTGFFRHPHHFDLAAEHARQTARTSGSARIWSAAAATGEEPYSLAMAMIEAFGCNNPPVRILATDVDDDSLAVAVRGEYGDLAMRAVESHRRATFFSPPRTSRNWAVTPTVRRMVEFRTHNLARPRTPLEGPFDVIFCRNVLMYFEPEQRLAALRKVLELLAPGGLLMLDPTETPGPAERWLNQHGNGVFVRPVGPREGHDRSAHSLIFSL